MKYKQLTIEGYIEFKVKYPYESYTLDCKDIEILKSEQMCHDLGAVVLAHYLKAKLRKGIFHLIIAADFDRIISIERGDDATEHGLYYDLSNVVLKYGNKIFNLNINDLSR